MSIFQDILPTALAGLDAAKKERLVNCNLIATAGGSLYYDVLRPDGDFPHATVILLTGGGHTGVCYRVTPDGRPGWADRFLAAGYEVIVPDWPGTGRSGYLTPGESDGESVWRSICDLIETLDDEVFLVTHSMSGVYGWKILEQSADRIRAVVGVAPGPPGNIQPPAEVISQTGEEMTIRTETAEWTLNLEEPLPLDERQVKEKLIGNSIHFPMEFADIYRSSLVPASLKRQLERNNVDGLQFWVDNTDALAGQRVLIVTGGADRDHPRDIDEGIATWLRDCGCHADYTFLPDIGIQGNGHMLMLEDNSDEIADYLIEWMRSV